MYATILVLDLIISVVVTICITIGSNPWMGAGVGIGLCVVLRSIELSEKSIIDHLRRSGIWSKGR